MGEEFSADTGGLTAAAGAIDAQVGQLFIEVDGLPVAAEHACVFGAAVVSNDVHGFMSALADRFASRSGTLRTAEAAYTGTDADGAANIEGATWI